MNTKTIRRYKMKQLNWFVLICAMLFSMTQVWAETSVSKDQVKTDISEELDINSAGIEEIAAKLDGVGQSRAEAIVSYRDEYGAFKTIDELLEVKGVGEAILEKNRHKIRVN